MMTVRASGMFRAAGWFSGVGAPSYSTIMPWDIAALARRARRGLARALRCEVGGREEARAGFGGVRGGQLVQRRGGAVVLDHAALEHRGVGPAGADGGELILGDLDGLGHLGLRVLQDARDVVAHGVLLGSAVMVGSIVAPGAAAPPGTAGAAPDPGGADGRPLSRR